MTGPALCPARHRDNQPRRAAPGLQLCWSCRDRLERHLAELPALHKACEASLQARGSTGSVGPVTGTTDPGLSLSVAAVAARTAIVAELHSWTRIALEEGPWDTPPANRLEALATWLIGRVDWLAARHWAAEISRTIADTHGQARRAAYPEPVRRVPLGPCPEPGCEGELSARVRTADSLLPTDVRCDINGQAEDNPHVWTADEWRALRRRMTGVGYAALASRIART